MNSIFARVAGAWNNLLPLIQVAVVFFILFFASNFIIEILKRRLLKRATNTRQKITIDSLANFLRYSISIVIIVFAISATSNLLKEFGLTFGILGAAIGFALQRPITGVAAWVMVIIKRPFEVGDRVTLGDIKGNVKDITLSHIYLEEVGRYGGEEVSGRTIIFANSKLFEENIINYSFVTEYILGQVIFTITYESELEEAISIALAAIKKHTGEYNKLAKREPHIRMEFTLNGMEIHARYFVPFALAQLTATNITKDIYLYMKGRNNIKLAYQQHVLHNQK